MAVDGEFSDEQWEEFRTTLERMARARLAHLRRADGDFEDVVQSALRTFWERQKNSERAPEKRDEPPEDEAACWVLLFKHFWRKAKKYKQQEKAQKRSALRSSDVSDQDAYQVFYDNFVKRGDISEQDADLYIKAAIEPLSFLPDDLKMLAEWLLVGYSVMDIAKKLKTKESRVRTQIYRLRAMIESEEFGE